MKFIHVADIHASRERLQQTLSILNTLTERCKQGDIDFILFAGDFWDSTITATKGSGFSDIVYAIRQLERYVHRIFFIYGTPTHEPSGSLDAFKSDVVQVTSTMQFCGCESYGIIAIPEPRRSEYVGKTSKEIDEAINKKVKDFIFNQSDRKQTSHKDIPLIVMYHGEVGGAVYQNGITASSPTAISKKLLQSLNADYYALGHIHIPQEVFPNAWYSGSACPKNFGETHDGHYNLVTIENGETKVEEVSFGLPRYITVELNPTKITDATPKEKLKNAHLRFVFELTREERKQFNIKLIAETTRDRLNCLSVKLEPTVIESEPTFKSEVVKHKSIVEKMVEYAKEKSLKLPKYAKELLQDIQDNTLIKLAYPQHSFELLSLSLRGAIGIRDGQHTDEYRLNFEALEDGVVCLAGPCGRGKSTLLENCHPYPRMLTRDGTLKDHFYLKDSHRILIYKDENGLFYKISMLIDGKTANGKASYYVETSKDREVWHSIPEVDGSLDSYKEWVEETFGSVDVFLRTAFFAKEQVKNTPDIADTTKGERMELLSKLAGTDHLKEVSVIAREQRKDVIKECEKLDLEIDSYSHYGESIKENEKVIAEAELELTAQEKVIKDVEARLNELKAKDLEYQKVKAVADTNKLLKEKYEEELSEKEKQYKIFDTLVDNHIIYEQIETSNQRIAENAPEIKEYQKKLTDATVELSKLKDERSELNLKGAQIQAKVNTLVLKEKHLSEDILDINEVCPTCGAPLSQHKKDELEKHNADIQKELEELRKELKSEKLVLKKIESEIQNKNQIDDLQNRIAMYESELSDLQSESQACEEYLRHLPEEYFKYSYDDAAEEHIRLSKEIDDLRQNLDTIAKEITAEDVSEELYEAQEEYNSLVQSRNELSAIIKAAERENERYAKELETIADKKAELKDLEAKVIAYNFIEDAFSNKGIPAIELRESAPEISEIANKILEDSYGNKFEIRFGSTSEVKAKKKADEDFNILVFDNENGDEKTIDNVSSGEKIWIKQALFYAFSIVQMNRTGFNFRTRLIDESDGSLDGGLRPKYLNMVTSAHRLADARLTILISHSQEIKDIAQQIIEI